MTSTSRKCKSCGSADIEVDPGRGDAVCTSCGSVLEINIIVAEVQFEEGVHGNSSTVGQFVAADSKGGATKFGASFHVSSSVESREITLKKARNGITNLCNQLHLNQHCIDTACGFFKMALSRDLTKGRRNSHIHAACVYLTCRTEGTAHLLIDISDVLQICCFELGKAYLKLSQALCINIPAMDPCLYILRYAANLEFGAKTQLVANTALRLVQRMKRDSIHTGRRPSGLCGAALLIAARLHDFGRTISDILRVVKVHESTLKKRLFEFGDTPSSALTLEEFMTVDLEDEQDPPSFKAARKKDKERLQKVFDDDPERISQLQIEIDQQLRKGLSRPRGIFNPDQLTSSTAKNFIEDSTLGTIHEIIVRNEKKTNFEQYDEELGPDSMNMGLATSLEDRTNAPIVDYNNTLEYDLSFDQLDDNELDSYILTDTEFKDKSALWNERYGPYLEEQKQKAEKRKQEQDDNSGTKPERKKRRTRLRSTIGPQSSAGEAIEKILQEKKLSTKINYDVLKSLNTPIVPIESPSSSPAQKTVRVTSKESKSKPEVTKADSEVHEIVTVNEEELEEDYYEEEPKEDNHLVDLLRQHREDETEEVDEETYYGYDEDEY